MKALFFDTKNTTNVYDQGKLAEKGYGFDSDGKLYNIGLDEPTALFDSSGNVLDGQTTFATNPDDYQALTSSESIVGGAGGTTGTVPMSYGESVADSLWGKDSASNLSSSVTSGFISAATTFVMTGDVEKAAKTGVGTAVGQAIGTAITLGNS
jgi:hypothetical protein